MKVLRVIDCLDPSVGCPTVANLNSVISVSTAGVQCELLRSAQGSARFSHVPTLAHRHPDCEARWCANVRSRHATSGSGSLCGRCRRSRSTRVRVSDDVQPLGSRFAPDLNGARIQSQT